MQVPAWDVVAQLLDFSEDQFGENLENSRREHVDLVISHGPRELQLVPSGPAAESRLVHFSAVQAFFSSGVRNHDPEEGADAGESELLSHWREWLQADLLASGGFWDSALQTQVLSELWQRDPRSSRGVISISLNCSRQVGRALPCATHLNPHAASWWRKVGQRWDLSELSLRHAAGAFPVRRDLEDESTREKRKWPWETEETELHRKHRIVTPFPSSWLRRLPVQIWVSLVVASCRHRGAWESAWDRSNSQKRRSSQVRWLGRARLNHAEFQNWRWICQPYMQTLRQD